MGLTAFRFSVSAPRCGVAKQLSTPCSVLFWSVGGFRRATGFGGGIRSGLLKLLKPNPLSRQAASPVPRRLEP